MVESAVWPRRYPVKRLLIKHKWRDFYERVNARTSSPVTFRILANSTFIRAAAKNNHGSVDGIKELTPFCLVF
jgi:hypothetical protein